MLMFFKHLSALINCLQLLSLTTCVSQFLSGSLFLPSVTTSREISELLSSWHYAKSLSIMKCRLVNDLIAVQVRRW
jgi:hypothetical protein